jgi:hypothetical protein
MKYITLIAAFIISTLTYGQNLIGYKCGEIRKYMNENHRDMNFNNVLNIKYIYLKYTDNSETQTLLFFLSQDSVCKRVRLICDSGLKNGKVKEFNRLYSKRGENCWIDSRDNKNYLIKITDEKWSCIITIEPDK